MASPLYLSAETGMFSLNTCIEVMEDSHARYRINAMDNPVMAAQFHPVATDHQLNFGYSLSAYWLRCRVTSAATSHWLLEVGYPSLDSVQVFTERPDGGYQQQQAGDLLPFSARVYPHRNFIFPLTFMPGTHSLYIRVRSQGSLTVPLTLWQPETFHQQDVGTYATLALYYGIVLALGLYNLLLFFSLRERVYLEYVLFVTGTAIGMASLNGFGNQFFWPGSPAWGNISQPIGFTLCGLFASLFTRSFLATAARTPLIHRMYGRLAIGFTILLPVPFFSYYLAAILTSLGGLTFAVLTCGVSVYSLRHRYPGAQYFALAWAMLLFAVATLAARNFGWLPTTFVTLYGMQIGSALEMLLLSFALAERIRTMRREKDLAQADALLSRQQLVESLRINELTLNHRIAERTRQLTETQKMLETALGQEKEGRNRQAHLLALMAHEIRSPLAIISNTSQMLNILAQSDQPNWQPRLKKILSAVQRLTALMDNLLAEERLSVDQHGLERQAGDLNLFCTELVLSFADLHHRPLRFVPWEGNTQLYADWQLIGIAIGNLIDNAVKYAPPNSDICVRVQPGISGALCVEVSDQGSTIPAEIQQQIFEKFIRGGHKTSTPGVGLGLYLVNWIAKFHGGMADVISEAGLGNTFRIYLPGRQ